MNAKIQWNVQPAQQEHYEWNCNFALSTDRTDYKHTFWLKL